MTDTMAARMTNSALPSKKKGGGEYLEHAETYVQNTQFIYDKYPIYRLALSVENIPGNVSDIS